MSRRPRAGHGRGDRRFCPVDPVRDRCLRTVENPTLLQARAPWDGTVLSVELPADSTVGEPAPTGETRAVDYRGRTAVVELLDGPWAAALSAHLGREVVLAAAAPGAVVDGAPVSPVTSASLARLSEQVGAPVDGARFRATFELDCGGLPARLEETWIGRRLRLGAAGVRVRRVVPRCAAVDLDPAAGVRGLPLLKALAGEGLRGDKVGFGVDAEVTVPGRVGAGDVIRLATP